LSLHQGSRRHKGFQRPLCAVDTRERHFIAVTHNARDLIDHHIIKYSELCVFHHALKLYALYVTACLRVIAIYAHDVKAVFIAVFSRLFYLNID
jgi:hypothetical protein